MPGKSHGRRSLVGCSPWGRWGSDMTERLHFHFSLSCIGEGNGNRVLAWRIPGTGEPGGLPSMGSHTVGHDWSDLKAAALTRDVRARDIQIHVWRYLITIENVTKAITRSFLNHRSEEREIRWRPESNLGVAGSRFCPSVPGSLEPPRTPASPRAPGLA